MKERTFELGQEVQGVLVSWRLLPHVGRQDRVGIVEDISLLQILSDEVTDRIDLVLTHADAEREGELDRWV